MVWLRHGLTRLPVMLDAHRLALNKISFRVDNPPRQLSYADGHSAPSRHSCVVVVDVVFAACSVGYSIGRHSVRCYSAGLPFHRDVADRRLGKTTTHSADSLEIWLENPPATDGRSRPFMKVKSI